VTIHSRLILEGHDASIITENIHCLVVCFDFGSGEVTGNRFDVCLAAVDNESLQVAFRCFFLSRIRTYAGGLVAWLVGCVRDLLGKYAGRQRVSVDQDSGLR
jgi:hypothetical protein